MDLVLHDALLHVLKVHAPDALGVLDQGREDHVIAVVGEGTGEADVGGGVQQHVVTLGAEHVQGADHAAQNAVFIADVLPLQAGDPVAGLVPLDNGVEVLLGGLEIAEGRMLGPLDDGLGDGRAGREVHVGHPHRDGVQAILDLYVRQGLHNEVARGVRLGDHVDGDGVLAMAVHDRGEIVLHCNCNRSFLILHPLFTILYFHG